MRHRESLSRLRRLYAAQGIAGIHPHVLRLVSLVVYAGNYPAVYSPTRQWDHDAFVMLANDFSMHVLEKNGYLAHALRTARDEDRLYLTLETSFRHYLINQKTRTVGDNLYRRILKLLAESPEFEMLGSGSRSHRQLWKMSAVTVARFAIGHDELRSACCSIDPLPVKDNKADSKKLPSLIATGPLGELVKQIFKVTESALTASQLVEVVQEKLGLAADAMVSLDEPVPGTDGLRWQDLLEDSQSVERTAELGITAAEVVAQFSDQERETVTLYARGASMDEIARAQNRSKSSVHNCLYAAIGKIKAAGVEDLEDAKRILHVIAEDAVSS